MSSLNSNFLWRCLDLPLMRRWWAVWFSGEFAWVGVLVGFSLSHLKFSSSFDCSWRVCFFHKFYSIISFNFWDEKNNSYAAKIVPLLKEFSSEWKVILYFSDCAAKSWRRLVVHLQGTYSQDDFFYYLNKLVLSLWDWTDIQYTFI